MALGTLIRCTTKMQTNVQIALLSGKKFSVQDCVTHLQNIVQRQYDEARLAVLGRREYLISEPYREHQVN